MSRVEVCVWGVRCVRRRLKDMCFCDVSIPTDLRCTCIKMRINSDLYPERVLWVLEHLPQPKLQPLINDNVNTAWHIILTKPHFSYWA